MKQISTAQFLGAFAKLRKWTIGFVMCVCVCPSVFPHGTTRLPLDGFSWNLICDYFSKICRDNSSFINIGQEWRVLCMKASIHLWSYLAQFFLECELFQSKVVEKIKTHIMVNIFFKSCRLWDNVEKYFRAGQATDDNMAPTHCMLDT
jgi:hypothetical protein